MGTQSIVTTNSTVVTTTLSTTTTSGDCRDKRMWCIRYKMRGWCRPGHRKYQFALENCQNTCTFCQREDGCHDHYDSCREFLDLGYCNKRNFQRSCRRSCGYCFHF